MKKFYNSLRFLKLATIPLFLLLTFSITSYSQTRLDTVIVEFPSLNNPSFVGDSEDNIPFTLTNDYGVVTNLKFEILYDETDFDTYIKRFRDAQKNTTMVNADSYTMSTVENYTGGVDWQIWLYEESSAGGDSAAVRITYQFDTVATPVAICKDTMVMLDGTGSASISPKHVDGGSEGYLTVSPNSFDCKDLNTEVAVTLTATATDGSTDNCTANVYVSNVSCKDTTLYLDANGEATVTAGDLLKDSTYACAAIDTIWLSQDTFKVADIGTNMVTLYAKSGLDTTWCTSKVEVMDTLTVIAGCKDTTLYLDANGSLLVPAIDVLELSSGTMASVDTVWLSKYMFDCTDTAENAVTLYVEDINGDTTFCSSTITVWDTISPVVSCKDSTVSLAADGTITITPMHIDDGSVDNCSIDTMWVEAPNQFNCADAGDQTVTLMVQDASGNTSSCSATVTIVDDSGPLVACQDITVYLRANGQYILTNKDINNIAFPDGADDNCTSVADVNVFPRSFDCANANNDVVVTVSASDQNGNISKCSANVTVLDTFSAEVTCVESYDVYLDEDGKARIFPGYIKDEIIEGEGSCGSSSIWLDIATFSCDDLGENTVTLTVSDGGGNEASCTSTVNVYDTIAPMVEEIMDIEVVLDPGVCETSIVYPTPVYSDNCDVALEQTEGLGPDGMFPLGTTTETWELTDSAGNMVMVSFDVVVTTTNDAPTLDSIENVTVVEDTPEVTVELTGISAGNDCVTQEDSVYVENSNPDLITNIMLNYTGGETGSVVLEIAPESSGEAHINITVEDSPGAVITRTFMVTVTEENDSPVLVTPIPDQVVNASYVLKVPVPTAMGIIFDDVDDDELTYDIMLEGGAELPEWMMWVGDTLTAEPMIADTGCVTVVIQATDAAGETAMDEFEVCVDGYPVSAGDMANQFSVKVYPNPTRGLVNIELNSARISDVDLSVHDITGRQILRKSYSAAERISFNLNENVSGMYFIKLNVDGNQILKKVILNRR